MFLIRKDNGILRTSQVFLIANTHTNKLNQSLSFWEQLTFYPGKFAELHPLPCAFTECFGWLTGRSGHMLLDRDCSSLPWHTCLQLRLRKLTSSWARASQQKPTQQQAAASITVQCHPLHVKRIYQVSLESMRVQCSQMLIPTKTTTVPETSGWKMLLTQKFAKPIDDFFQ